MLLPIKTVENWGNGKYYIRSGSNNFELKREELTNFLIEKSGKTWDEFVEEKAGFKDWKVSN